MKYNQITIKDIARELGISPSTVSRALKDHPDISRETKKAVNDLAEKLNYEPNVVALSLRSRKTKTIGVVIPELVHFFFSTVISGIEHEANASGYTVILTQSAESLEREKSSLRTLYNSRVDGMLISISRETTTFDHITPILDRGIPVVFYDRILPVGTTSGILVEDYSGARDAVRHLVTQGCKSIGLIQAAPNLEISLDRKRGYQDALSEAGLPLDDSYVIDCQDGEMESGRLAMEKLLSMPVLPDGVFANNDALAIGALKAIRSKGLRVPQDIALIGFSNWAYSQITEPPLSTVDQPGFEMGRQATRMLITRIEHPEDDKPMPHQVVRLQTGLVVRESSLKSGKP